ncbi:MAG: SH3 domain-containing protein [Phototrophicaceae bacterium]
MWKRIVIVWVLLLWVTSVAQAQDPQAEITSPLPISLLKGTVTIQGTVNLDNLRLYFLQFRQLNEDLLPVDGQASLWSPATLPNSTNVTDGVLGEWDTSTVEDGIYELQLVVFPTEGLPIQVGLSPVRVENTPQTYNGARYVSNRGATPPLSILPSITPQTGNVALATATPVNARQVVTVVAASVNVRLGDSTLYPVVGYLLVGEEAEILGRSPRANWYQVQLDSGEIGFVAASGVRSDIPLDTLNFVDVPPLPYTPTPTPTATPIASPTPTASGNLQITSIILSANPPSCRNTFTVTATVANVGTAPTASGTLALRDVHVASNTQTETTIGGFGALNPGATFSVVMPITIVTYYDEAHRLELTLDNANTVVEANESDNFSTTVYTLARGTC